MADCLRGVLLKTSHHNLQQAIAASLAMLCWYAVTSGVAAQGGKAEPLRIEFARGRDTASVGGTLRGDAQREYVVIARKNQRLTVATTAAPAASVAVQVRQPDGARLPLVASHEQTWSAVLPESGEYFISVNRGGRTSGRSQYTLTVTIR
jgi:hypothetical protein